VLGGALRPDVGTTFYAIVTAPGTGGFTAGSVRAVEVFPVTSDGEVFLPPWVGLDASETPPLAGDTYQTEGEGYSGHKVTRDQAERAMRQP